MLMDLVVTLAKRQPGLQPVAGGFACDKGRLEMNQHLATDSCWRSLILLLYFVLCF